MSSDTSHMFPVLDTRTALITLYGMTEGGVIDHCRGKIASFKIPRHVIFVDDFPMTSSGKIQKVRLRDEALRRLRAE